MSRNLLLHFHFPLLSDTLGNTDAGINNTCVTRIWKPYQKNNSAKKERLISAETRLADIYLFKVSRNCYTRAMYEICSNLKRKTPEPCQ